MRCVPIIWRETKVHEKQVLRQMDGEKREFWKQI